MNKIITLNLHEHSDLFLTFKQKFSDIGELGIGFQTKPTADMVTYAVIKTLKDELFKKGENEKGDIDYQFDDSNPEFYYEMAQNIEMALNYKIHPTTAERIVDFTLEFLIEESNNQLSPKKIDLPTLVDPDNELNAIIDYLTQTWDGFDKVDANSFLKQIWDSCLEKTRNQFDQYKLTDIIDTWGKERKDFKRWLAAGTTIKREDFKQLLSEDEIKDLQLHILMSSMKLNNFIRDNWDYEKNVKSIISNIKAIFPESTKLKPKGWKDLSKNYQEQDGMDGNHAEEAIKVFKGTHYETASSYPFEIRVSLPHVMYDDKEQGRKPLEVLIGAILGHAYVMSGHNNGTKMLKEIIELKEKYDQPKYYQNIVKKIEFEFKENLTQAMFLLFDKNLSDVEKELKNILQIENKREIKNKI